MLATCVITSLERHLRMDVLNKKKLSGKLRDSFENSWNLCHLLKWDINLRIYLKFSLKKRGLTLDLTLIGRVEPTYLNLNRPPRPHVNGTNANLRHCPMGPNRAQRGAFGFKRLGKLGPFNNWSPALLCVIFFISCGPQALLELGRNMIPFLFSFVIV